MFLRSLTLKGFKYFADPTTLELEPGLTAVVGPNGSGKSNIVDAVAWVLGAQGPRSVRSSVLLCKLGRQEVEYRPDFVALEIPDEFVVGYGLDYQDAYRNLPYIATLDEDDIARTLP